MDLWEKIKPYLWGAGIRRKTLPFDEARLDVQNTFLADILPLCEGIQRVIDLVPLEVWDNYAKLGIEDLREQIMLKEAYKKLREAWLGGYTTAFPQKEKKVGQANTP